MFGAAQQCTTGTQPPELVGHFPLACNASAAGIRAVGCLTSQHRADRDFARVVRSIYGRHLTLLPAIHGYAFSCLVHATPHCHFVICTDLFAFGLLQFGALAKSRRPQSDRTSKRRLSDSLQLNNAMTVLPSFVFASRLIPREPGSKDNLGPFVNVVTWILLITSALAVLTRLITKRALRRRIDVDDVFVIAALVCVTFSFVHRSFEYHR
jgi:hypothetical protein